MKEYHKLYNQNFKNNKDILSGVTTDIEFDKWLSYETEEEKQRKNYLRFLDIKNNNQINELKKYEDEEKLSKIINKFTYNVEECNNEEYNTALEYIYSQSIEKLIERKIDEKTKKEADIEITRMFIYMGEKDLSNYIDSFTNQNFKDISIKDAYKYHQALILYKTLIEQEEKKERKNNNIFRKILFLKKEKASC